MDTPTTASEHVNSAEQLRWFKEEVEPHERMLRGYLHKNFPKLSDIDDVVQECYLKLYRMKAGGALRSARAFLFKTAHNAAIDRFRQKRTVSLEAIVEIDPLNVIEDRPGVAETVSRNQELDLLADAIESLPSRCRQALKLRKIYGLSHKEIAECLNISERTVNVHIGNGVRRCGEYLQARNITIQDSHEIGGFKPLCADES